MPMSMNSISRETARKREHRGQLSGRKTSRPCDGGGGGRGRGLVQVGIPPLRPRNPFLPRNDELESERAGEVAAPGKTESSWGINHDIKKNKYCITEVNAIINNLAVFVLFR
jgi:hypothetical protein